MPYAMEWRACARFPDWEVSEFGDLRRRLEGPNRPVGYRVKGSIDVDGYLRYAIRKEDGSKTSVPAYRLVAEAFLGPPPSSQHEVAHESGSRVSAYWRDLRWDTRKANDADTVAHGTNRVGERNGRAKITEDDVHAIRREYRQAKLSHAPGALVALELKYGLHRATIIGIATGKSWKHIPFAPE